MLNENNAKPSRNMFKMQIPIQTYENNLRKNVAINKNYSLRKNCLNFQNPKFNIL